MTPQSPTDIANELAQTFGGSNRKAEVAMQEHLIDAFCSQYGWRRARARSDLNRLWLGPSWDWSIVPWDGGHLFDHTYYFRRPTERAYAIASHPYDVNESYKLEAAALANKYGLIVEYPDFPSWWRPPATTLVVWTRNPLAWNIHEQSKMLIAANAREASQSPSTYFGRQKRTGWQP
jgi:hypothetical protein